MAWSPTVDAFKAGSVLARVAPAPARDGLVRLAARAVGRTSPERRLVVERNLSRIHGPGLSRRDRERSVDATFESYGRYWVESFRLPSVSESELDGRFAFEGYEYIEQARHGGHGPLMVIPHLGGWEWAAFWLTRIMNIPVTAVVEPLEPPEVFEWFAEYRRSLGMNVVPLGPSAASEVARAVKDRHVVCLLADRDIAGNGAEVEFFGERTTLPSGPALLAIRTGAPLIPCGVYFESGGVHKAVVRPPIAADREGRLRDDVARITQAIARELEYLIRRAPEQWHVMEPNWPSDREAVEAIR